MTTGLHLGAGLIERNNRGKGPIAIVVVFVIGRTLIGLVVSGSYSRGFRDVIIGSRFISGLIDFFCFCAAPSCRFAWLVGLRARWNGFRRQSLVGRGWRIHHRHGSSVEQAGQTRGFDLRFEFLDGGFRYRVAGGLGRRPSL